MIDTLIAIAYIYGGIATAMAVAFLIMSAVSPRTKWWQCLLMGAVFPWYLYSFYQNSQKRGR